MLEAQSLDEKQRLLIVSAALQGYGPDWDMRASCAKVIALAMRWIGEFTEEAEAALSEDPDHPSIRGWYQSLIAMTRHLPSDKALLEGQGNLVLPACPAFTACRLTALGKRVAEQLLADLRQHRIWSAP